jgi:hypothetical protein
MNARKISEYQLALGGEIRGAQLLCPGPGHSSADRSLSIMPDAKAPDGMRVNSFAGDDLKVCRAYIRERLGEPAREPPRKQAKAQARGALVGEYIYRSADGAAFLRVCKYVAADGGKQFPQYHLHPGGGSWLKGKPAGPKIPYRLPELMASASSAALVHLTEGEKDADALAKLGLVATTASEGAHAKWAAELTPYFKDRDVVILVDADAIGRAHGAKVARALAGTAKSVKVVDLFPDHVDGHDVSDWLASDPTGERLAQVIKDAPPWEAAKGAAGDEERIADLALMTPLAYARERKEAAAAIGIGAGELDGIVRAQRRSRPPAEEPQPLDAADLRQKAKRIIANTRVLDLFATDLRRDIAGEEINGKLLYLVATSRLFPKPMHGAIKGTSAGGKSEIRKKILEFFPPEDVISFTSLSEKALLYFEGGFAHKILSMGEAMATEEQAFQDYLLRELMSAGRLDYPTCQKLGDGQILTVMITKEGPVSFLVTTTKAKLHPENETRMLSLEIDDSERQTKAVLRKIAASGDGMTEGDLEEWRDFQRWLGTGDREISIPFADSLAELIPPAAVRLRRDFGQVLTAIDAHTLLHREHRPRNDRGDIVADIDNDYRAIYQLMASILAEGAGVAVNPAMVETIDAVNLATAAMLNDTGATAQDIGKILRLDKSAARRRLIKAKDEGYVTNLETRRMMQGKYRVTQQAVEKLGILPTPEELLEKHDHLHPRSHPRKTAPPCHREEKALTEHQDDRWQAGGKQVATVATTVAGGKRLATALPPVKSMTPKTESLPVARWHEIPGETAGGDTHTRDNDPQTANGNRPQEASTTIGICDEMPDFLRRCSQCGQPGEADRPVVERPVNGAPRWVHASCDPRPCDQCGAEGDAKSAVTEYVIAGRKFWLHGDCAIFRRRHPDADIHPSMTQH